LETNSILNKEISASPLSAYDENEGDDDDDVTFASSDEES
jgi:hypothetical protein